MKSYSTSVLGKLLSSDSCDGETRFPYSKQLSHKRSIFPWETIDPIFRKLYYERGYKYTLPQVSLNPRKDSCISRIFYKVKFRIQSSFIKSTLRHYRFLTQDL